MPLLEDALAKNSNQEDIEHSEEDHHPLSDPKILQVTLFLLFHFQRRIMMENLRRVLELAE